MDSREESKECDEEDGSEVESESGVASLALATTFVSMYIFNLKENDNVNNTDDCDDDFAPTYCLMEKGSKVPSHTSSSNSSNCEPDDYRKPSYYKLANIATKQQTSFEKLQKLLDKSDDPLSEEMNQSQTLTDDVQSLQSMFDSLQERYGTLLAHHEKLFINFFKESKILRN